MKSSRRRSPITSAAAAARPHQHSPTQPPSRYHISQSPRRRALLLRFLHCFFTPARARAGAGRTFFASPPARLPGPRLLRAARFRPPTHAVSLTLRRKSSAHLAPWRPPPPLTGTAHRTRRPYRRTRPFSRRVRCASHRFMRLTLARNGLSPSAISTPLRRLRAARAETAGRLVLLMMRTDRPPSPVPRGSRVPAILTSVCVCASRTGSFVPRREGGRPTRCCQSGATPLGGPSRTRCRQEPRGTPA